MADEATEQEFCRHLHIIQNMIDVSAERLEGLRTQCATSAELTQQEIRTLEVILCIERITLTYLSNCRFFREN